MQLKRVKGLLAAGVLVSALSLPLFAQAPQEKDQNQRDRVATTLTGCLNKDASGAYILTDQTSGAKTTVAGLPDLEKHSGNHKVTLTGTVKTDAAGKPILEVMKLNHISDTCTPPQ
jgi:hypothetical protein